MQGFANSIAALGMVGPGRNLSLAIEAFGLADHGVVIHRCYLIEIDGMQHPQVFHPVAGSACFLSPLPASIEMG